MVKNSENPEKSKKNSLKKMGGDIFILPKEKNCYPLSFPIFGGRDSTRTLQSSLFQKNKNLKKSLFFKKKKIKKKKNFAGKKLPS